MQLFDTSRRWVANLGVLALACGVMWLIVEVALPYFVRLEKVSLTYDALLGFRGRAHLRTDFYREMKGKGRVVQTNGKGFHDVEQEQKKAPGTYRVVFLGDSFVEAYQVEIEDNFCSQTGRLLNRRKLAGFERVETLNQGLHGYGLGQYYLYVRERLLAWSPDAVVLALFLGNDLHDNFTPLASPAVPRFHFSEGGLKSVPAPEYTLKLWLRDNVMARSNVMRFVWLSLFKSHTQLLNLARAQGLVSTPDMTRDLGEQRAELTAVGRHLLGEIVRMLEEKGVLLTVYLIPDPLLVQHAVRPFGEGDIPGVAGLIQDKAFYEQEMVEFLKERGILYIFPKRIFVDRVSKGQEVYLDGYGHFSRLGHRLSAKLIEEALISTLEKSADLDL